MAMGVKRPVARNKASRAREAYGAEPLQWMRSRVATGLRPVLSWPNLAPPHGMAHYDHRSNSGFRAPAKKGSTLERADVLDR